MKQIESLMFGEVQLLEDTDEELVKLMDMITKYPANTFGILNKMFNNKGLAILLDTLPSKSIK